MPNPNPKPIKNWQKTAFKKGQVANPLGSRAHDPIKKALKQFTLEHLEDTIKLLLVTPLDELKAIQLEPSTTAMKAAACAAIIRATRSGDWAEIEGPLARVIGKVKEKIEHTGVNDSPLIPATSDERKTELEAILAVLAQIKKANDR